MTLDLSTLLMNGGVATIVPRSPPGLAPVVYESSGILSGSSTLERQRQALVNLPLFDRRAKPMSHDAGDITRLLEKASQGDAQASEELISRVYTQLQALARKQLSNERSNHTFVSSDLVHEAWMRLVAGLNKRQWPDRRHFWFAAGEAMRRVLVDHARGKRRIKRGSGKRALPLDWVDLAHDEDPETVLIVDEALQCLEDSDPRLGAVVRLRFFTGLSLEETAHALDASVSTITRDWAFARAWLQKSLSAT